LITYDYYLSLLENAKSVPSMAEFVSTSPLPEEISQIIYTVANGTFKDIVAITGLKMTKFSKMYGIKYRTVQTWVYGDRPNNHCINQFVGYAMIGNVCAKKS
jgi:DNA-binding transcriptional regulator YiaG